MIDFRPLERFGLLLVRPGMLVAAAPCFAGAYTPVLVRVGLTVLLTFILFPLVHVPDVGSSLALAAIILREMAIGLALALAVQALIGGAELAGSLAGFQIGLSYGSVIDPQSGVRNNLLAMLYGNVALLTFFAVNGHHALVRALATSFTTLPIGSGHVDPSLVRSVATVLGMVFVLGVRLAMPVIVVLLVAELAMGLLARAAPAVNLMATGMPLRLVVGLLVLASAISVAPAVMVRFATRALELGLRVATALR